ncbi:MAG TPA: hypothetical protein VFV10_13520, partial [Gammaproteobacteria bacterium]|nr:hypothetical protein [Gammaproteobacteria bacterium]
EQVVALLDQGRVEEVGPLLSASHASLRDVYRVTVPQLDVAAAAAEAAGALLGRRIRGERVAAIAPEASGKYRLVKH